MGGPIATAIGAACIRRYMSKSPRLMRRAATSATVRNEKRMFNILTIVENDNGGMTREDNTVLILKYLSQRTQ